VKKNWPPDSGNGIMLRPFGSPGRWQIVTSCLASLPQHPQSSPGTPLSEGLPSRTPAACGKLPARSASCPLARAARWTCRSLESH
jgi:hypothetical protein